MKCTVCYEILDINNIVNTQCNHKYCWECFFKWIKTNPSCPYCRCDFMSQETWYQNRDVNQDASNMRHLVDMLQLDLVRSSRQLYMIDRKMTRMELKVNLLKQERKTYLKSAISLNEQIEYMRGYHTALRGDDTEVTLVKRTRETPWFRGFTCGVYDMIHERNHIDYEKLQCFIKKV